MISGAPPRREPGRPHPASPRTAPWQPADLAPPSSPPTQASLKPYLDTIVEEPTVRIVQQDQIVMDHLPGWYYVYTFTDSPTHVEGIHAQYFIIRGSQLYSIVFQALPASDFSRLAPVYQQVAN